MSDNVPDPQQRDDVLRWRKAERERLIAARLATEAEWRRAASMLMVAALESEIGAFAGRCVSAYWPFRGEPDLRDLLASIEKAGGRAALPVVRARGAPLEFRTWSPGDPLARGVWNIPIPAGGEVVVPDVVIAPVVGFDPDCFRLGYGGGFFDRTLAALRDRPLVLGVGYASAAIPTIHPQWHDIPMSAVVTEETVARPVSVS